LRDGIHDNFIVEYHRLSFIITGGNDVEVQETFCDFDRSALQIARRRSYSWPGLHKNGALCIAPRGFLCCGNLACFVSA